MIYVDTSVVVALLVNEPHSAAVARWYARTKSDFVSAAWCAPEFASALGMKQRTGQLDAPQAQAAWADFERLLAHDLRVMSVHAECFHWAAMLTLDAATALLAGDAVRLDAAVTMRASAKVSALMPGPGARCKRRQGSEPVERRKPHHIAGCAV